MISDNAITQSLSRINEILCEWFPTACIWGGKAVTFIKQIPDRMQENPSTAYTVIALANALFFFNIALLANWLDDRIDNVPKKLDADEKRLNRLLINGLVVGGSVFSFNLILSKITRYKMSYQLILAITAAQIGLRLLFNHLYQEEDDQEIKVDQPKTPKSEPKAIVEKAEEKIEEEQKVESEQFESKIEPLSPYYAAPPDTPKTKADLVYEELFQEVEPEIERPSEKKVAVPAQPKTIALESLLLTMSSKIAKAETPAKNKTTKSQSLQVLREKVCSDIEDKVKWDFDNTKVSSDADSAREKFITELKENGTASIEAQRGTCRTVCGSIQVALETILQKKIANKEISKVEFLCLSILPCAPLRAPIQYIEVTDTIEWEKNTHALRTNTLRQLRVAGVALNIGYSASIYQDLLNVSETTKAEVETYENEKKQTGLKDYPLTKALTEDVMGELYLFEDKEGHRYQFIIQGRSTSESNEKPKEQWTVWFSEIESDPEADAQRLKMQALISN